MLRLPGKNFFGLDLFNDMFEDPFFLGTDRSYSMLTDIKEVDNNYILDINLPGFDKNDIKVELKNGYLTVTADKEEKKEEKDEKGNYIRRERYSGRCMRSYYVGEGVKEEDVKASYKDGILNLSVPKKEAPKLEDNRKYIDIN